MIKHFLANKKIHWLNHIHRDKCFFAVAHQNRKSETLKCTVAWECVAKLKQLLIQQQQIMRLLSSSLCVCEKWAPWAFNTCRLSSLCLSLVLSLGRINVFESPHCFECLMNDRKWLIYDYVECINFYELFHSTSDALFFIISYLQRSWNRSEILILQRTQKNDCETFLRFRLIVIICKCQFLVGKRYRNIGKCSILHAVRCKVLNS